MRLPILSGRWSIAGLCLTLMAILPARATSPNVVFIMVDDMGWGDMGAYGGSAIGTPHLDKMAEDGMKFTQFYAGSTVCAPSRCALMTGKHLGRASVRGNTGGVPLLDADITVAELFKKAGYATGGFGKWGLGDLYTSGAPERQGFDRFFGYYHQIHAHYFYPEYLVDTGRKTALHGNKGFYDSKPSVGFFASESEGSKPRRFAQYAIFEETLQFIRDHAESPFFLYAPWTPPHGRYEMPSDDPAVPSYVDKPWPEKAKVIAAMVEMIDRQVGALLALLAELELDRSTVVFFCSDHGAAERMDGSLDSSGPLRGRKRAMYEGGLRTPLLARWPGVIPAGQSVAFPGYFPDILPTALEIIDRADLIPEDIDGISFARLLTENQEPERAQPLYWEWPKYNWNTARYDGLMQAIRHGNMKALRHAPDEPWELYDLEADPGERNNVASQEAAQLEALIDLAAATRTDPRPQIEPPKPTGRRYR